MASSANKPNGTFKGPISYQQSKKSWTEVITGGSLTNSSVMSDSSTSQPSGEPDPLTSRATSPFPLDHFTNKVFRPYLTGTVAHSIVIDITNVIDKKKAFIFDLAAFCEGNTHLWAVSEQIRKDNNRLYAEISVSLTMYQKFLKDPSFQLENFAEPFMAYPSLSPSANIVKLSLTKLPPQYGRQLGNQQLRDDIHFNLNRFGNLIDCGYVTGGSGIYAGGSYAVLAVETQHEPLEHSLNWAYHPIDYSSPSGNLLPTREQVLAFATWAVMPPYCKYCHSMDHALLHCELRKKKLTCDLCHGFGHFQRECPRRNEASSKSGKKRKVSSGQQKNAVSTSSSTSSSAVPSFNQAAISTTAADSQAAAAARAAVEAQAAVNTNAATDAPTVLASSHQHYTRSNSAPKPQDAATSAAVTDVCKHCNLPGHKRTTHNACLKNPKKLQKQLQQDEDGHMDLTESFADQSTDIRFYNDESDSAAMQD